MALVLFSVFIVSLNIIFYYIKWRFSLFIKKKELNYLLDKNENL